MLAPRKIKVEYSIQVRPIDSFNVVYKVTIKFIKNHLKPILPSLISREKMAYMEGRKRLDGIMVSLYVSHSLKYSKW